MFAISVRSVSCGSSSVSSAVRSTHCFAAPWRLWRASVRRVVSLPLAWSRAVEDGEARLCQMRQVLTSAARPEIILSLLYFCTDDFLDIFFGMLFYLIAGVEKNPKMWDLF